MQTQIKGALAYSGLEDESIGESGAHGWYGRYDGPIDIVGIAKQVDPNEDADTNTLASVDEFTKCTGAIVRVTDWGIRFVIYDSAESLRTAWADIEAMYAEYYAEGVE